MNWLTTLMTSLENRNPSMSKERMNWFITSQMGLKCMLMSIRRKDSMKARMPS